MVRVLGLDVEDDLLARWQTWLAPERQPFFVRGDGEPVVTRRELTAELRDTFTVWRVDPSRTAVWHDEASFSALPRSERAALVRAQVDAGRGAVPTVRAWRDLVDPAVSRPQADGHRFVWWPSLLEGNTVAKLTRAVEEGETASRHDDVDVATWRSSETLLPGARELAGTFSAAGSGPNCFGTVMAAAGVADAAVERVVEAPFLEWLGRRCVTGGLDGDPGTVLVWSVGPGQPVHAAVTLGDGWALEKPSQCWWTPRTVLRVEEVLRLNRAPGQRLQRHRLLSA